MLNRDHYLGPVLPSRQGPLPQPQPPQAVPLKPVIYGLAIFLVLIVAGWHLKAQAPELSIVLLSHSTPSVGALSLQGNVAKIIEYKSELAAHALQKWPLPMSKRATVRWNLEAAAPVRLLLFQSPNDATKYIAHQPYTTYNCSELHTQRSDSICTVEPQAMLAIENPTDASVSVALSVATP